jgi:hypothetical protein
MEYPNHCPMKKLESIMQYHTISKWYRPVTMAMLGDVDPSVIFLPAPAAA